MARTGQATCGRPPLAHGHVHFAGEGVALVIAETQAAARDGGEAVVVDYAPLPAEADLDAALAPGALSAIDKELIALAIGVSCRCDAFIAFHVKALIRLGVSREQLMETLAVGTNMGGGPSLMHAAEAVRAYEEMTAGKTPPEINAR